MTCKDCKKKKLVNQNNLCFACWVFRLRHKQAREMNTEWKNELYSGDSS